MQITIQKILNFSVFYTAVKDQKLPLKTAYRLSKIANAIDSEIQFYHNKLQGIIAQYAEKDENGKTKLTEDGMNIKLRAGVEEECYSAINELQQLEIELPDIYFSIDDFANVELTPIEFSAIMPFVEE